jgi:hypothetical protein
VTDQPSHDRSTSLEGRRLDAVVPVCDASATKLPCWTLVDDAVDCPGGKRLTVARATSVDPDQGTAVTCQPCPVGRSELGCP